MLPTAFLLAYSLISNLLINQILQHLFGHLAHFRSVVWPYFVRSFGAFSFGRLAEMPLPGLPDPAKTGGIQGRP